MLWRVIVQLRLRWRRAFLLNPPRGFDLDIFPALGAVSIEEIGATLALEEGEYETIWNALALDPAERGEARKANGAERFAVLWRHLPLPDAVISLILGAKGAQAVINLRRLARDEIAEEMHEKQTVRSAGVFRLQHNKAGTKA